jgi:hypothetical protein
MNKCDATIVTKTKSSQNTNCDHFSDFNDVNVTSLMTTSLLVLYLLYNFSIQRFWSLVGESLVNVGQPCVSKFWNGHVVTCRAERPRVPPRGIPTASASGSPIGLCLPRPATPPSHALPLVGLARAEHAAPHAACRRHRSRAPPRWATSRVLAMTGPPARLLLLHGEALPPLFWVLVCKRAPTLPSGEHATPPLAIAAVVLCSPLRSLPALTRALALACWPAPPLSSLEFGTRRPHSPVLAAGALPDATATSNRP